MPTPDRQTKAAADRSGDPTAIPVSLSYLQFQTLLDELRQFRERLTTINVTLSATMSILFFLLVVVAIGEVLFLVGYLWPN